VLVKQKRYIEALELACSRLPTRVPEVLKEAGHSYHEQGLHKRLFYLLEELPKAIKSREVVLYWRVQAAFRLGREHEFRQEVEHHLKNYEAPDLRAFYAGVLAPFNEALSQAERAYLARKNAYTAFQYARLTNDSKLGLERSKEAVAIAERSGRPYEVIRNAGNLVAVNIIEGNFQEAVSWGQWVLGEFDRLKVKDSQRRLRILNDWIFARILRGELAGLETLLLEHEAQLASAYPTLAYLFRSTLGDYYLAIGQANKALQYYRYNHEHASRSQLGETTLNLVRALTE
jgi:hypothetical protein